MQEGLLIAILKTFFGLRNK